MTEYKPGTVAKATVRGVPDVRVFKLVGDEWALDRDIEGPVFPDIAEVKDVTDVRPLVVLDLDDTAAMDRVAENFFHEWSGCQGSLGIALAETLRKEVKPPRIPEPGTWGVVEASLEADPLRRRSHYVRDYGGLWRNLHGAQSVWSGLVDPVLVREGV